MTTETETEMQRTWTDVGDNGVVGKRLEGGGRVTRSLIERAIDELDWQEVTADLRLAAMPGLAIREVIVELKIGKPSLVAVSTELAPYGFYGIEGNYTNGRARVYVADMGSTITPLCSDFWPIPPTD